MERTDQQLVADYLNGNETVLPELLERHIQPVYAFVRRMSGNQHDAEDITQEAFIKVWRSLKKYKPEQSFKTWVFSIARNAAIDLLRKKRVVVFSDFETETGENPLLETLADPEPLPDKLTADVERKKILDGIIGQLPNFYREVLLLRYNDHFTFEEIAEALGKSVNTVKSQHRRAIFALRKILDAPAPTSGLDAYI